jgi:hypothetical protein
MAVVRVSERYGDDTVELLGVPSDQLADVAVWRGRDRAAVAELAGRLRPEPTAPLVVGGTLTADVEARRLSGGPRLAAVVAAPGEPARPVDLGQLTPGEHRYRAALPGCGDGAGCRLVGLAVTGRGAGTVPFGGDVRVGAISSGAGRLTPGFAVDGRWRVGGAGSGPRGAARVSAGETLLIRLDPPATADVRVEYVDTPDRLPVALAGPTPADDPTAAEFTFPALGDATQPFTVVDRPTRLPRAGPRAVLFDLDYAVRSAQRGSTLSDNSRLRYEVWATAAAPADLDRRLADAGVRVLDEQTIAGERGRLARAAPALGLVLYLLAGGAAMALAVGAVLLTAYVGAQARRYELAALRVTGVRPMLLRRGLVREYAHLLLAPVLAGLLAGLAGAALMLPGMPVVTVGAALGELAYEPGPGALPAALAATAVGLVLAVVAVVRLVGQAQPERLRDGAGA